MQNEYNRFMPAEWEKHQRTFIEWPVKDSLIWPENYAEVCGAYAKTAKTISEFEPITVIVNSDTGAGAEKLCGASVDYLEIPHNDGWVRDNGPTFVRNRGNGISGINWNFNAWGEKYKPYDLDNKVAAKVLKHYNIPCFDAPIILEGGSIHVDGEGTLLTTEQCLLNPNRNKDLSREQIEEVLKEYLGISKIIWLKRGLFGDETDGHIDNAACFVKPGVILFQACHDKNDPNYEITQENLDILRHATDASGKELEIIEITQPPARYYKAQRLTLSYLNFYIVNDGIILPVFGTDASETDKMAENILQNIFPDRKIVTIDGVPLIKEGGNVHCITQQMPAPVD